MPQLPPTFLLLQYRRFELQRSALTPYLASVAHSSAASSAPAFVSRVPHLPVALSRSLFGKAPPLNSGRRTGNATEAIDDQVFGV